MVSPNLIRRQEVDEPIEINSNTKKLFQVIYSEQHIKEESDKDTPVIRVSQLISRLAFVYEKVRNAVDYDEDHLLRKNAIARILRRQVFIEGVLKEADSEGLSNHLLVELIRGGYLPNNKIPETKIQEVALMLEKYIRLKNQIYLKVTPALNMHSGVTEAKDFLNEKNSIVRWILNIAACEIEEILAPNKIKQVIVGNMFDILAGDITLPKTLPYENDLEIQIYLSIGRKFLKLDKEMLSFVLFKYYNDSWLEIGQHGKLSTEDEEKIQKIAGNIKELGNKIEAQLAHPLAKQLDKIVRRYSLYFNVLLETVENDPTKVYGEIQKGEKSFLNLVRKTCEKKYSKAKSRLWRAAMRSIIYIFLTKSVFVFLIEIPAIHWFNEPLNPLSLAINVAFPAILLFFIVLMTQRPQRSNTEMIVDGIKEISFLGKEKKQPLILRLQPKRGFLASAIFNLIYSASFLFSIYIIVKGLTFIGFNWVSIIIFLFFLAFVSFFSIIVARGIKDLMIIERQENLGTFVIDLFYMPIILVGRWLSNNMSRVNIFIFIFDFIIEAPFKILVEVAEDWTKYVRERRDNME
ncbi:MAG TPA: hypothetical protein VFD16_01905 [Candidatus Saccharimonadales bacterium]|nr:hypothetical protein [Candidatus Saccharimonadales bacterium]